MKIFSTLSAVVIGLAVIAGSQAADLPKFRHVTIDAKVKIGYGTAIADMNGDKKPDIILCDARNIAWYENPSWRKHIVVENLTQRDHVCIAVRDIDGDGKADLAGCTPGWGCEAVIEHQLDAFGLRDTVTHNQGSYSAIIADTITRFTLVYGF